MTMPSGVKPDRAIIHPFVVEFYARLRKHEELGPIFESRLGGAWDSHMERLTDFWITMLGGGTVYRGNPFEVHRKIEEMAEHQFEDWLAIFSATAGDMLPPALAAQAVERAHRIANSLRMGLFYRPQTLNRTVS